MERLDGAPSGYRGRMPRATGLDDSRGAASSRRRAAIAAGVGLAPRHRRRDAIEFRRFRARDLDGRRRNAISPAHRGRSTAGRDEPARHRATIDGILPAYRLATFTFRYACCRHA